MARELPITLVLDDRLYEKLDSYCLLNKLDMGDFIVDAIRSKVDLLYYGDLNEKLGFVDEGYEKFKEEIDKWKEEMEALKKLGNNTDSHLNTRSERYEVGVDPADGKDMAVEMVVDRENGKVQSVTMPYVLVESDANIGSSIGSPTYYDGKPNGGVPKDIVPEKGMDKPDGKLGYAEVVTDEIPKKKRRTLKSK